MNEGTEQVSDLMLAIPTDASDAIWFIVVAGIIGVLTQASKQVLKANWPTLETQFWFKRIIMPLVPAVFGAIAAIPVSFFPGEEYGARVAYGIIAALGALFGYQFSRPMASPVAEEAPEEVEE